MTSAFRHHSLGNLYSIAYQTILFILHTAVLHVAVYMISGLDGSTTFQLINASDDAVLGSAQILYPVAVDTLLSDYCLTCSPECNLYLFYPTFFVGAINICLKTQELFARVDPHDFESEFVWA